MGSSKPDIKSHNHISFLKSLIIIAAGCTGILLLCLIDYLLTGENITFSLLYLIPVGITVWFAGITGGVIASVLSTSTWFFIYFNKKGSAEITSAVIINFILKLRLYSGTAKASLRNTDFFARMGGDEFAVLLPETDYVDAGKAVESLYEALNRMAEKLKTPCSVSIGMVTYTDPPETPGGIVGKADELMYYSKKHGKNRITSENCIPVNRPRKDNKG